MQEEVTPPMSFREEIGLVQLLPVHLEAYTRMKTIWKGWKGEQKVCKLSGQVPANHNLPCG